MMKNKRERFLRIPKRRASKFALFVLFAALPLLHGCKDDNGEVIEEITKRTVLAYIVGENSLSSYISLDVQEMRDGFAALNNAENNNLLVYIDDYNAPKLLKFKKVNNQVVIDTLKTYPEQNSLDISVMKNVMSEVFVTYQAEDYGLILWSHANGWLPGSTQPSPSTSASPRSFGDDRGFYMDVLDLKTALEACPKFSFILFDACNMQCAEVLYELQDRADYFIGSPGEIPAYGAPYSLIVPAMFSQTDHTDEIAQQYFDFYDAIYSASPAPKSNAMPAETYSANTRNTVAYPYGVAISVVKAENLKALAAATKNVILQYAPGVINTTGLVSYDANHYNYYYDLGDLVRYITSEDGAYASWKTMYDKAVVKFLTTDYVLTAYKSQSGVMIPMQNSTGLAAFIPIDKNGAFLDGSFWRNQSQSYIESKIASLESYYRNFQWYTAGGWSAVN